MHRIDTVGSVAGAFTDTNPATIVDDDWLNAVQEEVCNLIEAMGVTLVKGTNTQLRDACVAAATAQRIMRRDAAGRAKVADPSAADDIATKGYVDGSTDGTSGITWSWTSPTVRLRKLPSGIVIFHFSATTQASTPTSQACVLPAGYRPADPIYPVGMDPSTSPPTLRPFIIRQTGVVQTLDIGAESGAPPANHGMGLVASFYSA